MSSARRLGPAQQENKVARRLLRGEHDHRVGFAELFFDLVFVFAITQISHHLLHHYDLKGAFQSGLILLAVWWVWVYTTWVLNRLDPEAPPVRGLLFALMLGGLFLSMSIPEAFAGRGWVFGLAFAAMQLGRTAFMYAASGDNPVLKRTFLKIFLWFVPSALLWVVGGLAAPDARFWIWTAALAVEYAGPAFAFWVPGLGRDRSTNWNVKGEHMAERAGLFVIICLGETLLVSGATFSDLPWDSAGLLAFLSSAVSSIAMWWVYFHIGYQRGSQQIVASDDPGRIARLAFTYAHIPIVAGIVLAAVGAERAIAHPHAAGSWAEAASIVGGTALFLAGNGWFKAVSKWFPLSHLAGLGLLTALFAASPWLDLLWLNLGAAAVLVLVAVWEDRSIGSGASRPT